MEVLSTVPNRVTCSQSLKQWFSTLGYTLESSGERLKFPLPDPDLRPITLGSLRVGAMDQRCASLHIHYGEILTPKGDVTNMQNLREMIKS